MRRPDCRVPDAPLGPRRRRAGVLLHPTSLPGSGSLGPIGVDARRFIDLLAASDFTLWQVLPLGPVDESLSPYQLRSAFAGNPALLDPAALMAESWWPAGEGGHTGPELIPAGWGHFQRHADAAALRRFTEFRAREAGWLLPYALFAVLTRQFDGSPWWQWPEEYRDHHRDTMRGTLRDCADTLSAVMFGQFLFDQQWRALHDYARARGVGLFGDLPFYVDRNSADVWWQRHNFRVDQAGTPDVVAGVPPDCFNADGQLWGNPVYDWTFGAEHGFDWWLARLRHQARWFDLLRIDHFRALESCWVVPAGAATARDGHWEPVPGDALLTAVGEQLPELRLVAEDLGTITPAVTALRRRHRLPGMLVLQFAFDGSADNPYLPANHVENAVIYTGTHDNDTTLGWYRSLSPDTRAYVDQQLGGRSPMPDTLVEAAYRSPARLAVVPMQDLLRLGGEARMNTPGTPRGNWSWRFRWEQVDSDFVARCRAWAALGNRVVVSDERERLVV
jgi:4-alpha-glucanotransferase